MAGGGAGTGRSHNAQHPNSRTTGGRLHLPEMFISSQRTSTTRCPAMSSLAMMEQRRPRRCPRQSTTTVFSNIMENCSPTHATQYTKRIQTHNHHWHRQRLSPNMPIPPLRRPLHPRAAPARVQVRSGRTARRRGWPLATQLGALPPTAHAYSSASLRNCASALCPAATTPHTHPSAMHTGPGKQRVLEGALKKNGRLASVQFSNARIL